MNRRIEKVFFTLLAIAGLALAAQAQNDPVLERYLQEALSQNPSLKTATSRVQAYDEMIPQAGALPDPMLGIGVANLPTDSWNLNQEDMSGITFSLEQMVPFPGKLRSGKDKASSMRDEQQAMVEDEKAMLIMTVKETYYNWAFMRASIQVVESNRALMDQILESALSKYKVGMMGNQQDVLMAQTDRNMFDEKLLVLRQAETTWKAKLNILLNHKADDNLTPPLELQYQPVQIPLDSVNTAIDRFNPKMRTIRARQQASDSDIRMARKEYYPDVGFMVEYMRRNDMPGGMERPDLLSFQARLNLPLFWKSKQERMVEQRRIERRQLDEESQSQRKDIEFQLADLIAQNQRLKDQIALYQQSMIPLARQSVESAQIGYQVSKVDFQMLVTSQMTLLNSELELQEMILDYYMVWMKIEALTGQRIL
jgi:outer membrane protein TolC